MRERAWPAAIAAFVLRFFSLCLQPVVAPFVRRPAGMARAPPTRSNCSADTCSRASPAPWRGGLCCFARRPLRLSVWRALAQTPRRAYDPAPPGTRGINAAPATGRARPYIGAVHRRCRQKKSGRAAAYSPPSLLPDPSPLSPLRLEARATARARGRLHRQRAGRRYESADAGSLAPSAAPGSGAAPEATRPSREGRPWS